MNELQMSGCRPEPLGSYLKALGVLRVLGEQKDPEAKGSWRSDIFELRTNLTEQGLIDFLVREYRPTPLVAPWNGRGGFRTDVNRESERVLRDFQSSTDTRLEIFRRTINSAQEVFTSATDKGWDRTKDKALWVALCRSAFPDEALQWIDAIVVLTNDDPVYPPLLGGAGGVLGSMDLSVNFMQNLSRVLVLPGTKSTEGQSMAWLSNSLFGVGSAPLVASAAGQFDPGAAGGVNSSPLGDAGGLINPWDYVLLLEGALVFASAAARRLSFDARGKAAMPFTVDISPVGYASGAVQEASRGEAWLPLWSRPVTCLEACHFIGEGRSEWGGRRAKNGLDMAKATANLGVDRGIEGFSRHAFLERHGQSNLAVPIGRIAVKHRVETALLVQIDLWVDAVRRAKDQPAGITSALSRMDRAAFELTQRGEAGQVQDVLVAVAGVEAALVRSPGFREKSRVSPLSKLRAEQWLPRLDDGSAEVRLAAAAASQYDEDGACLRWLLRPVGLSPKRRLEWSEAPAGVPGFGVRPVADVLAAALIQRAIKPPAGREASRVPDAAAQVGRQTAFQRRMPAPLRDVAAFLSGDIDDERLGRLLAALLLLDWSGPVDVAGWFNQPLMPARPVEPAWALLAPFFHGRTLTSNGTPVTALVPMPWWPTMLVGGRIGLVAREAILRLRMARLDPAVRNPDVLALTSPKGTRLAAALMFPVSGSGAQALLRRVVPNPVE